MTNSTSKRKTRNSMRHELYSTPRSPTVKKEITLRSHFQNLLDELPQDLPTYYHEALLDDLCFLLRSPLFLYVMRPRIRRGEQTPAHSTNKSTITRAPVNENLCSRVTHELKTKLDMANLRMKIEREERGWVTRLLYNVTTLIEGRENLTTKDIGFVPSFLFFCEEVAFLGCEFKAREHAAAVSRGTSVDKEIVEKGSKSTQVANEEKKKRRLVKLKIRFRMARGRPMRTRRMAR